MTTKEQERTALNKIRNILGTLDADGWVNTAFKGVCDIAQENIDNDFACSPIERIEVLEKELEKTEIALDDTKCELADTTKQMNRFKERLEENYKKDSKRCEVLDTIRTKYEEALEEANKRILDYCGDPESAEFKSAVVSRQDAKRWIDKINAVL